MTDIKHPEDFADGLMKGIQAVREDIAKEMLLEGYELKTIARLTMLSLEEVMNIEKEREPQDMIVLTKKKYEDIMDAIIRMTETLNSIQGRCWYSHLPKDHSYVCIDAQLKHNLDAIYVSASEIRGELRGLSNALWTTK